ncbi:MAG TPA: DNA internalization-related competence protein ComEC/Rec2 [Alcanivorax sp.]|nr:DNA internalization-related competence protein ComEC/Rec2 [Alcanivorax sp.]
MRYWFCSAAIIVAVWWGVCWPLAVLAALALALPRQRLLCLLLALAAAHGLLALEQGLDRRLPEHLNGATLTVDARVVGLPVTEIRPRYGQTTRRQRLVLDLRLAVDERPWPGRHRVRVTAWAPLPELDAGDRLRGKVRLFFPHGWYNQTGPDRARFDLSNRIDARGVLTAVSRREARPASLDARRDRLSHRVSERLSVSPAGAAVIPALVTGDRRGLDPPLWGLFRDLGTAHLLAISGLHLTLVTGLLWGLGRWLLAPLLWLVCPPARRFSLQQWAWAPALVGALGYAALAGFALPTQRALIMVTVLAACRLRRVRPAAWAVLGLALLAVLLRQPLAALSAGLWLSFTAVAVILLLIDGTRWPVMVTLPLLMAVLGAWLFDTWAWLSPLANLLLVPLFSVLVVPAALLGVLLDLPTVLLAAATGVEAAVLMMEGLHALPSPALPPAPGWIGLALLASALLWLLPAWPWPRWLLLLGLLPWWLPGAEPPAWGQVDLIVFEVGQGQALALRTQRHLVLYDLGPGWPGGSAAKSVLLPWLRRHGLTPDITVVSHGDNDHAGGLSDLSDPGRLLSGEPDRVAGAEPCRAGQQWRFDGVRFEILWPPDGEYQGNAASCVLRVDARGASALLTGDIPKQVEYRLLGRVTPVTVLQLAHHGSGSSSSAAWLRAVTPRWAVASMGYANRFNHPDPDVVDRLEAAGVTLLRTDRAGMIVFRLGGPDNAALITKWRRAHGRPWHREPEL